MSLFVALLQYIDSLENVPSHSIVTAPLVASSFRYFIGSQTPSNMHRSSTTFGLDRLLAAFGCYVLLLSPLVASFYVGSSGDFGKVCGCPCAERMLSVDGLHYVLWV